MVKYRHCGHRFDNGYSTWQDTWIMTSASSQSGRLSVDVDCILRLQQSGNGFESHTEIDVLTIGNSALNAATVILNGRNTTIYRTKDVVLLRASLGDAGKALTILKALDSINAKHGSP